jgi:drug/metabolite transporter (DMT)-like permease
VYVQGSQPQRAGLIYPVYIFVGTILLDPHTLNKVFGSIIGVVGVAYIALEFIPSIEPPQNMRCVYLEQSTSSPPIQESRKLTFGCLNREADAGWGAEEV